MKWFSIGIESDETQYIHWCRFLLDTSQTQKRQPIEPSVISTTAQLSLTTDRNNTPTSTTTPNSNSSDVIMKDVEHGGNNVRVDVTAHGVMDQSSLDIRARKSRWADTSDMDTGQDAGLIPAATTEVENSRAAAAAAASVDVSERLAPPAAESKPEVDDFYGPSLPPIQCKLDFRLIQNQATLQKHNKHSFANNWPIDPVLNNNIKVCLHVTSSSLCLSKG